MNTQRNWPLALGMLLWLFAIGAGIYMTQHHEVQLYGPEEMQKDLIGCVESAKVSCDIVNTSDWSELMGVPLFTWAIPFYAALIALAAVAMAGKRGALWLIGALGIGASCYSLFLGYISYVELGKICQWCIRLYMVSFATPVLAMLAGAFGADKPKAPAFGAGAITWFAVAAVAIMGQRQYRAGLLQGAPAIPALADVEQTPATEAGDSPGTANAIFTDPKGPPPSIEWNITTEDGNQAVLKTDPGDPWKGNPDAKVVIMEFADFECGYCKRASGQLKRLFAAYQDRIAFVYKHFPIDPRCNPGVKTPKHPSACAAAKASVCAQEQGKFWAYHDLLFKNQHNLKPDALQRYALASEMDVPAFSACMGRPQPGAKVTADGKVGASIDLHGTPRIWIDGKLYRSGTSAEQMAKAIEIALGSKPADAAQTAKGMAGIDAEKPIQAIAPGVPAMRKVSHGGLSFEIDTFESALDNGIATSGKHQIPATHMSWFAAKDACEKAGKRLCSQEEWVTACQGARAKDDDGNKGFADDLIEGTSYPYGDYHRPGRCWDGYDLGGFCNNRYQRCMQKGGDKASCTDVYKTCSNGEGYPYRPVYTGEMPGCESADGVYDLTGNMEEWVGTSEETAILLGGSFDTAKDNARCYRPNSRFGPGYANKRTGFRCCR